MYKYQVIKQGPTYYVERQRWWGWQKVAARYLMPSITPVYGHNSIEEAKETIRIDKSREKVISQPTRIVYVEDN